MKVIASVNHSGGVGKTTLATTLAHWLALQGQKTIIIDLDGQGNVSEFLGLSPQPALLPFLYPECSGEYIRPANRDNLWIISNTKESNVQLEKRLPDPECLSIALDRLARVVPSTDYVVIDSPPSVGMLHTAPLLACDYYVVPVKLDKKSMTGARSVAESTADLDNSVEIEGKFAGFAPNFWDRRTTESNQWLQFLYALDRNLVLPPIPTDARLPVAMSQGQTIWEFASSARSIVGVKIKKNPDIYMGGLIRTFTRLLRIVNR